VIRDAQFPSFVDTQFAGLLRLAYLLTGDRDTCRGRREDALVKDLRALAAATTSQGRMCAASWITRCSLTKGAAFTPPRASESPTVA